MCWGLEPEPRTAPQESQRTDTRSVYNVEEASRGYTTKQGRRNHSPEKTTMKNEPNQCGGVSARTKKDMLFFNLVIYNMTPPPRINYFDAVIHMQESSPHKRFLVGCSSMVVRPWPCLIVSTPPRASLEQQAKKGSASRWNEKHSRSSCKRGNKNIRSKTL